MAGNQKSRIFVIEKIKILNLLKLTTMATNFKFTTADSKQVNVFVYGKNYAAHVCLWGGDCFAIEGRDTYECLKSEGKYMTWNEIVSMFK